jgi:SAM-dependent methyltransferase
MSEHTYSLDKLRQCYGEFTRKYGYDPHSVGWTGRPEQLLRMKVLADIEPNWSNQSVLDVGCGFCNLVDVLRVRGFCGRYVGVDITDEVLEIARQCHPEVEILNRCILTEPFTEKFDYTMASGTFNIKFCDDMSGYVAKMLKVLFEHSTKGVAVNYLSTYVDFQHPLGHHTDPGWIFDRAKKLSKRVILRHDYMPYEFTLYLYKDDRIRTGNVFVAYDSGEKTDAKG